MAKPSTGPTGYSIMDHINDPEVQAGIKQLNVDPVSLPVHLSSVEHAQLHTLHQFVNRRASGPHQEPDELLETR